MRRTALECYAFDTVLAATQKQEYDHFVYQELAEAEEYAKRPDVIRYSLNEFFKKNRCAVHSYDSSYFCFISSISERYGI